jgi:hypothetical protein
VEMTDNEEHSTLLHWRITAVNRLVVLAPVVYNVSLIKQMVYR